VNDERDEREATLDVAFDAWLLGDSDALHELDLFRACDRIDLATRAHARGCVKHAAQLYLEARQMNPRVCLRGDARVLAIRTRKKLRDEVADLMQWDPRQMRVGHSVSPSVSIKTPWGAWRAWWTEEQALEAAHRESWQRVMSDAIEEATWTGERVDRNAVAALARDTVERLHAEHRVGELLGDPGPLLTTVSGFAIAKFGFS
jgi:hypothetical protein